MSAIDIYELDGFKKNYIESKFQEIETSFGRRLKGLINRIESKEGIYSYKKYVKKHLMNIMLLFYFRANKEVEELCKLDNYYLEKLSEKIFKNYKFYIIHSEDHSFMLSDSYISIYDEKNRSLEELVDSKEGMILIPVSSKYYILFTNKITRRERVLHVFKNNRYSYYDIDFYNKIIYRNSYIFIVGRYKEYFLKMRDEILSKIL